MHNIAIIPARGGSKRIPKKNIRPFNEKPIIAYSIESAIKSGLFDEVMVSTDNQLIAECAIQYNAKVPFFRSANTADDFSTISDVLLEVIEGYNKIDIEFDNFCCLLPTAPFVTADLLKMTQSQFIDGGFSSLLTVNKFSFPIFRAIRKNANNKASFMWPEFRNTRSQDLEEAYHDAGQLYWCNVNKFKEEKKVITDNSGLFLLKYWQSQDIDTLEDWELAELKYKLLKEKYL